MIIKSYVGDTKSYVGDTKSYIGDNKSYVEITKSYVGDSIFHAGDKKPFSTSRFGTSTLPQILPSPNYPPRRKTYVISNVALV